MNKIIVGKILKEIRMKKNLSQILVSEKIGISQSLLAQYEIGSVRNINKRTLIRILDFYELSPKYFEALVNGK